MRNRHGALLRGLLYCEACGRAMVHTFTSRGNRRYRYYTCTKAMKNGRRSCPTQSLPAAEIEEAVVEQVRCIARDPELVTETLRQARAQTEAAIGRLAGERRIIERGLARCHAEIRRMVTSEPPSAAVTARIADLNDQVREAEQRLAEIGEKVAELEAELVSEGDVAAAFADFDNVWNALNPREQLRLLQLLISRVEFDAGDSTIELSFYPAGIKALAGEADVEDAA